MAEEPVKRLSKIAREFNVAITTIVDFLAENGHDIESKPNTKVDPDLYKVLLSEFQDEKQVKQEASQVNIPKLTSESISIDDAEVKKTPERKEVESQEIIIKNIENLAPKKEVPIKPEIEDKQPKVVGKIDLEGLKPKKTTPPVQEVEKELPKKKESVKAEEKKAETPTPEKPVESGPVVTPAKDDEVIKARAEKLTGPKVVDKIILPPTKSKEPKPVASSSDSGSVKKKRKRIYKEGESRDSAGPNRGFSKGPNQGGGNRTAGNTGGNRPGAGAGKRTDDKGELDQDKIQKEIRETLARLSGSGKSKGSKYRKAKREAASQQREVELKKQEEDQKVLKVTEFVTANELSSMMDVPVNNVISACMSLGLFVSINQRLDAETLSIVADEFGYEIEFVSSEDETHVVEVEDNEEDLKPRAPIVTVMGHVDHGKTSLLDYIRNTNVIGGEAGGITQHIGAYSVNVGDDKRIAFLDTPGHEAFTAMRARGAQLTDIAIIVIAADDSVMPQTKEAINHAQAAEVPMVFAFNKMDKPGANPDKIKEELSQMNILVEDWGGKFQCQEISAKKGTNIDQLLEKVLLEAEMLELKANPDKAASGTVVESMLDKGRGYVNTILVQAGTLRVGDIILAGGYYGRVKAMHNERGEALKEAGPSTPVSMLGLNGAPNAGDKFNIVEDEREARNITTKRQQLQREQGLRTQKHITLDEIGRRLAIGDFQELNVIVKGDVDGSVEALSDSLLKLSTEKIQINVIHKSVGQISESDVLLATASDAIIIGFQVRPSAGARKLAEKEEIDVRLYSIIYNAIEELKLAMEGMLKPTVEERIVCNIEIRDVFKITKVGTVAGCYVQDGKIHRNTNIRLIRDGIVVYTGALGSLKRFKDDVKEVLAGFECGLNIDKFNDIKVGDIIEGYEEVEIKQTL